MTPTEHYPELAKVLGLPDLFLKREDLHPYGSHKGRSIPAMIKHYYDSGDRSFAISSSGNAALAAALYVTEINDKNNEPVNLDIFIGRNIAPHKLDKLKKIEAESKDGHIRVLIKERPVQALTQAVEIGARSLRQSTDDVALIGYESLAQELSEVKKANAVFVASSSGTTAQALAEYFLKNKLPIQVHIVQTSSCHPMSDAFETYDGANERSIADAIVSQTAQRKVALIPLLKNTGGHGWTASNTEIQTAKELVKKHAGFEISNNSALSIVGAMQAVYRDWKFKGPVICLVCGD